jgi:hypothetical protein
MRVDWIPAVAGMTSFGDWLRFPAVNNTIWCGCPVICGRKAAPVLEFLLSVWLRAAAMHTGLTRSRPGDTGGFSLAPGKA